MARAIEVLRTGLTVGHVGLGLHGFPVGAVRQQVHDGDTINVRAAGNFGVRFLGVDAPEISLPLPPAPTTLVSLSGPRWVAFQPDPLSDHWGAFDGPLTRADLVAPLTARSGPGTAANHDHHARIAQTALEAEIEADIQILGKTREDFAFFLAFANEIMDRYGRQLCCINRDQPRDDTPAPRPASYNERLLRQAVVLPYFIWPSVNPFRRAKSLLEAVPEPGTITDVVRAEKTLRQARGWLQQARAAGIGLFDPADRLRLETFEVPFLAQRWPPSRWVIDLSQDTDTLLPPQGYVTIPHSEGRLFIPPEYLPLFIERGWRKG